MTKIRSIYKSEKGKELIIELYNKKLKELEHSFESKYVNTRFGKTHILCGGPKNGEPILLFHGGQILNPIHLKQFEYLCKTFRLYALDTIGQPGKSSEQILSTRNNDFGHWVEDILDNLCIEKSYFIGHSVGGGILLKFASLAPWRIKKAVYIVPMGIAYGYMMEMLIKIAVPMIKYSKTPTEEKLITAIKNMYYDISEITQDMKENFAMIIKNAKIVPNAFKPITKKELSKYYTPSLLYLADSDFMHPAKRIIKILSNYGSGKFEIRLIKKSGHIISNVNLNLVIREIEKYITTAST